MKYDINLVIEAKQGDKQSFAILYEQVALDLYKMALYILGNSHDAEDAVSETFIEAYKGIHTLKNNESFKPWILRILSTRCKKKIKGFINARKIIDIDEIIETPENSGEDLSDTVIENVAIIEALNKISSEEREMIILSILHGYTTKEISEIMNKPHGTVCSKISRTFKKLRKYLERDADIKG